MASPFARVMPNQRGTGQGQITQRVQHLVADGFVCMAQAARARHVIAVKDNRVHPRRATKGQAIGLHLLDIAFAAECPAVAQLAGKAAIGHVQRFGLTPDGRVGKIDVKVDPHDVGGRDRRPRIPMGHRHGLEHFKSAHRRGKRAQASGHDTAYKRRSGPIEDRHFGAINFDQRIVNATAGQRRHHVFYGANGHACIIDQRCAKWRLAHHIPARRHHRVAHLDIGAAEPDAVLCHGGPDRQTRRFTGMQPASGKGNWRFDSRLHAAHPIAFSLSLRGIGPGGNTQLNLCNGLKHGRTGWAVKRASFGNSLFLKRKRAAL
mmetsp:Transcript_18269/g.28992  ORF Transcript_18269/g.28992 Transcript_18269/m.28992 type:complete len:319 (+) Transcript_18269:2111-3067(+)